MLFLFFMYAQCNADFPSMSVVFTMLCMASAVLMDDRISSTFFSSAFWTALSNACESSRKGKTIRFWNTKFTPVQYIIGCSISFTFTL